jgi:hypothetical protein
MAAASIRKKTKKINKQTFEVNPSIVSFRRNNNARGRKLSDCGAHQESDIAFSGKVSQIPAKNSVVYRR